MKIHYDVVIIGAGPAGLHAALAAAKSGQSIVILDDNVFSGGQIWRNGPQVVRPHRVRQLKSEIENCTNIDIFQSVKIISSSHPNNLLLHHQEKNCCIGFNQLILCTGGRELFLPFEGWTLAGVTGAGGLQAFIKAGMQVKNKKIVIAGTGPLLLACAQTATKAGADVVFIAEQSHYRNVQRFAFALWRWPHKILQALSMPMQRYRPNSFVIRAQGEQQLQSVVVQTAKGTQEIPCDYLACGYGMIANTRMATLFHCKINEHAIAVNNQQQTSQAHIFAAGECTGFGGSELSIIEGQIAGFAATGNTTQIQQLQRKKAHDQRFANLLQQTFQLRPEVKKLAKPDTIFCRCEDVSFAEVAHRRNWRDAKMHTRCGMGACQGRTCSAMAACLFQWQAPTAKTPLSPTRAHDLIEILAQSNPLDHLDSPH